MATKIKVSPAEGKRIRDPFLDRMPVIEAGYEVDAEQPYWWRVIRNHDVTIDDEADLEILATLELVGLPVTPPAPEAAAEETPAEETPAGDPQPAPRRPRSAPAGDPPAGDVPAAPNGDSAASSDK